MASQYYLKIRLDPHYQRFLRTHFDCETEVFEFPSRHRFNTILEFLVITRPRDYQEPENDNWLFRIALPNFERKNAAHFRYLSKEKEAIFKAKIKAYYDDIILDEIRNLLRRPDKTEDGNKLFFDRQECTQILIEEFKFNKDDYDAFDRLYKLYTRYKRTERNRRFWCRNKGKGQKI